MIQVAWLHQSCITFCLQNQGTLNSHVQEAQDKKERVLAAIRQQAGLPAKDKWTFSLMFVYHYFRRLYCRHHLCHQSQSGFGESGFRLNISKPGNHFQWGRWSTGCWSDENDLWLLNMVYFSWLFISKRHDSRNLSAWQSDRKQCCPNYQS